MANDFYISAGLIPIDNSTGAVAMTFYISAGLVPNDTAGEAPTWLEWNKPATLDGMLRGEIQGMTRMLS
jgi:hypothetical protein